MTTLGAWLKDQGFSVDDNNVPLGRETTWRGVSFLVVHHTASPCVGTEQGAEQEIAKYVREGGAGTYPPLAQIMLGKSGKVWMTCQERPGQKDPGRASHAGTGKGYGIADDSMNEYALGIECQCIGSHKLSTHTTLYSTLISLLAKLSTRYNVPVKNIIGHKEWSTTGKTDPRDDMDKIRTDVTTEIAGLAATPTTDVPKYLARPPDQAEPTLPTDGSDTGQSTGDFAKVKEIIDITKLRGKTLFNPPMYDGLRLPRTFYGEQEWKDIHKGGFGRGWIIRDPVAQEGTENIPPPEERELEDGETATKLRDGGWQDWQTPYGFRFLMNPSQVQETYTTAADLDTAGTLIDMATSGFPPVITTTGSAMSFTLLLDRQLDMLIMTTKGMDALYDYYDNLTGGAYDKKEIAAFGQMGTGWDLEYLFRTMNGDPWTKTDALWHGRETSDFGVLFPFPIIVSIGDGPRTRRIRATLTQISFNHTMFAPGMVPIRTEVDISVARLTDSWHTGGLNWESDTEADPNNDTGTEPSTGTAPSSPGKSLPTVKHSDEDGWAGYPGPTLQRGKWYTMFKQNIAKGQKWTVETQLQLMLKTATTPIRGYEISTRYARVGWGEGITADGKDYTGENDEQIAEHAENNLAYTHSHTLAGGGPLEYQLKVTGTGTVKLNHIIFKAAGAGSTGPDTGTTPTYDVVGAAGDVEAMLPSTYKTASAKVHQKTASEALQRANGKLGAAGYHNNVGYGGWCIQFVVKYCYGISGGVGVKYAYQIWDNLPEKYRHPGDTNPPAGGVPVWSSASGGGAGHAAVSVGGGEMITTGHAGNGYKIEKKRIAGYTNGYLGWIPPMFYGTQFPPAGSR